MYASTMPRSIAGLAICLGVFFGITSLLDGASPAYAAGAPAQQLHFDGGAATLSGPWQFHLGDDPQWADPGYDDSGWEKLSADQSWAGKPTSAPMA
jgi:hypothetical protein